MRRSKNCFKKSCIKTPEATRELIGNNIAQKTTSIGKPKEKPKETEEMCIPAAKRKEIIDDLKLF